MTDKMWEAEDAEGKFMEVLVNDDSGNEHVYWVDISNLPDGEDEYDWSIEAAVAHHNALGNTSASTDDAEANEPFSRKESEFVFVSPA